MARYIDADALKLDIDLSNGSNIVDFAIAVIKSVKDAPTADVAPRAELAREIFEEIENKINNDLKNNKRVLPQVEISNALWNRVSGKINAFQEVLEYIAELKKKYTEADHD